jgi:hypothetical protein
VAAKRTRPQLRKDISKDGQIWGECLYNLGLPVSKFYSSIDVLWTEKKMDFCGKKK